MTRTQFPELPEWIAPPVPDDIARLVRLACWDLWHGPIGEDETDDGEPWPGFEEATETVAAWASEHLPSVLYWEDMVGGPEGYLLDEPEGEWYDETTGDFLEGEPDDPEETIDCDACGHGEPRYRWIEPEPVYRLDRDDVVAVAFGLQGTYGRELLPYLT